MSSGSMTGRMQLGSQLRGLREARGITRADAGYAIRASESKISRLELGRVGSKIRDIEDLLALYGVTDAAQIAEIMKLAAEANRPGWWQSYNDLLPAWFATYLGLEEAVSRLRSYSVQFVPELLQTEEYARALLSSAYPGIHAEELDRRVEVTLCRQRAFFRSGGPHLWAVLDESVLHRVVGDQGVHRRQLEHLLALKGVTLQVLPFAAGEHPAQSGAFCLLRFPQAELGDIAYVQSLAGSTHHEKREEVDVHLQAMEHLCVAAHPPDTSAKLISALARPRL
ncbi:helix-turn-helix domain-containing protein [Actinocorallia populi]|uniref:helix-turn-helix domain-containing protein n=1 Tax=Actinocorallia populi TaxID=2079200 RepID=UPI000D0928EE|nr:helix-turn-helix transcriptional regulator [Actinocorallia populi]